MAIRSFACLLGSELRERQPVASISKWRIGKFSQSVQFARTSAFKISKSSVPCIIIVGSEPKKYFSYSVSMGMVFIHI
jgi:hypothetical protein